MPQRCELWKSILDSEEKWDGRNVDFTYVHSEANIQRSDLRNLLRFMEFGKWPISEVSGLTIATLGTSGETEDRDAWGLVCRKWGNRKSESRKETVKIEPFAAIDKKWLFWLTRSAFWTIEGGHLNGYSEEN